MEINRIHKLELGKENEGLKKTIEQFQKRFRMETKRTQDFGCEYDRGSNKLGGRSMGKTKEIM